MRNVTIRWRLTLWYSGVLAVVLTGLCLTVYVLMRNQLLVRMDSGVREELAEVVAEVERSSNRKELVERLQRQFAEHEGFDYQLTDSQGNRLFANPRLGEQVIPVPPQSATGDQYATIRIDETGRWRVVSRWMNDDSGAMCIQVARSLAATDADVSQLLSIFAFTIPAALALVVASGYVLANRFLSPIESMTQAARRISARRLDERIDAGRCNDELGRLGVTFNGMLDRLQHSFREMQRFTADASHEFRTPLAVIQSEAEGAMRRTLGEADKRELLGSILEECERMTWITDQLLTLCREDAGVEPARREPIDLHGLVATVVDTMQVLAESKQQRLMLANASPIHIEADPARLRQVVDNLIDNAIKYTPVGGEISVGVARCGEFAEFTVCDNGQGIPTEHLPRVFERFYRVDKSRSRTLGGAGLGLSIVHSVVQSHNGTVRAESDSQNGTCFRVLLPALPDSIPQSESHELCAAATHPSARNAG